MHTATWIAIALLAPFWWAMGLSWLALLGDASTRWRPRVSRLFDGLEGTRGEPMMQAANLNASAVREALAPSERATAP
jgi:hypothetical protein